MRRCALGEAELNNARLLPRAPPSALHIEFCISPVGAASCLSLVVCRETDSVHPTCVPISGNVRGGVWRKKKTKNKKPKQFEDSQVVQMDPEVL